MRSTRSIKIRGLCLLCCGLLMLSLMGNAPAAGLNDELSFAVKSVKTRKLNPLVAVEREVQSVLNLIYEPLVKLNDAYDPVPGLGLALKWECSGDGKTWTFKLRDDVRFHDGTPMTSADVVATINEILRLGENNEGQYQTLKYIVSNAAVNDDTEIVITAKRPCYGLLYAMTFPVLKADEVQADNPVGTGPYRVIAFDPEIQLLLNAFTDWHNGTAGYKELNFAFFDENKDLLTEYEYKRVDSIITRSATAAQYRGGNSSLNVTYRTNQLEVMMMNFSAFPLDDKEIRLAIRYSIDIDAIAEQVYGDMVLRTNTPLIPDTWTYYDSGEVKYDPDKAAEILAAKGWRDTDDDGVLDMIRDGSKRNLALRIYVYEEQENSVRIQAANLIADYLIRLGINATVKTMTFSEAAEKLSKRSYDLCLCAFQMDLVPDPGFLLMKGNTANYMGYRSDDMDALFKKLRSATAKDAYRSALHEIQALFLKDCPFVCLYYRTGTILTRRLFTNVMDVREPEVLRGIEYAEP